MRLSVALLAATVAASPVLNTEQIQQDVAPVFTASNAKHIPNSYIIKFKSHVSHKDAKAHHAWIQDFHINTESRKMELKKRSQFPLADQTFMGLKHTFNFAGNWLGYSGHFDESVIEQLKRHPDVSIQL